MFDEQMAKYGFVPMNHVKPIEFEVGLDDIFDGRGRRIPGHKAVTRRDSGDTLAVHSDKYALVPYQHHFSMFEKAIAESALDSTGMAIATDMQENGAKIFRQYLFPAHRVKIDSGRGLREVLLRIFMFDSYDGSMAFWGRTGAWDFVCANCSVSGNEIDSIRFKHTGEFAGRVAAAAERLTGAAERFVLHMQRLEHWPRIALKNIEFSELVSELPQSNPRLVNELTAEFAKHEGQNLWDAHNLLTRWATHGNGIKTAANRQARVGTLVEGELWKGLEKVG